MIELRWFEVVKRAGFPAAKYELYLHHRGEQGQVSSERIDIFPDSSLAMKVALRTSMEAMDERNVVIELPTGVSNS